PTPPLPVTATTRLGCAPFGSWSGRRPRLSPRDAMLSSRESAFRSPRWNRSNRESLTNSSTLVRSIAQEGDDLRHGRAGAEKVSDAHLLQLDDIFFGDDAADQNTHIIELGFLHQLQYSRHQSHVSAAQKAQT